MAEFVLVPGAWLGRWAWDDVSPQLIEAGHGVHPITLTGLAEKQGRPAGQQTHVQDIVDVIESQDLRDVVLTGHSYSGIPSGQAAERIGDRLQRLVLVDANVPADGVSFLSMWPAGRAMVEAQIAESGGFWPPLGPSDYQGQGLSDEQIERIVAAGTPQPAATITEPAVLARPLAELPVTYIKCLLDGTEPSPDVAELLRSPSWELRMLDTGHWPMFSQPHELAQVLLDSASRT